MRGAIIKPRRLAVRLRSVWCGHVASGAGMKGGMNGRGEGVMKDSASSVPSGELGTQPYIARVGTEDSGWVCACLSWTPLACRTVPNPPPIPVAVLHPRQLTCCRKGGLPCATCLVPLAEV